MAKKILIIEDEADIRELYSQFLRESGFEVIEAVDGQVGFDLAIRGEWDLLLLDIMLPKMDGFEILKKLRESDAGKNKPIVILTNLDTENIRQKGTDLGASGYVVKSDVSPRDVLETVQGFFSKEG